MCKYILFVKTNKQKLSVGYINNILTKYGTFENLNELTWLLECEKISINDLKLRLTNFLGINTQIIIFGESGQIFFYGLNK